MTKTLLEAAFEYMLLEQRRDARVGDVDYSLLVYKKDASLGAVTIEGAAVYGTNAWTFTATCASSDAATNGLPTILKQVGTLATLTVSSSRAVPQAAPPVSRKHSQ